MTIETKTKRLHYRKAIFSAGGTYNLQKLVTAALNHFQKAKARQQPLAIGSQEYRLINAHTLQQGMIFGDFFSYEAGANKLQVQVDPNDDFLDVSQVAPKQTNPKKHSEFLDSLLFFGIFNNHIVLMQSQAWQGRGFENYLNWLLEKAGLLGAGNRVELSDIPTTSVRQRATASDIKAVSFKTPVVEIAELEEPAQGNTTKKQSVVAERKIGAEVIRSILGDDAFDRLHLDRAAGGNLRVDMRITFERSTTESGQSTLNRIARALRHTELDDGDLRLEIPGVGIVKGSELKLTRAIDVQAANGIVNPDQVFQLMATWIRDLVQNNLVD